MFILLICSDWDKDKVGKTPKKASRLKRKDDKAKLMKELQK
jgi:hypothetical protein